MVGCCQGRQGRTGMNLKSWTQISCYIKSGVEIFLSGDGRMCGFVSVVLFYRYAVHPIS